MDSETQKPKIEYIQRWQVAQERLERAKREVTSAECELSNSEIALGKILCPKDAMIDEEFSVWTENRLITVKIVGTNSYKVSWRK